MKKQILRRLMFAAAAVLLFGVGAVSAQTLRIAYLAGPPTLDPHLSTTRATADFSINVFETLVGYGEDFSTRPQLATAWNVSDDGLVYTFDIRQGVTFHDGGDLTAADVVATLDRIREIGAYRARFVDVQSVEATDDYTV